MRGHVALHELYKYVFAAEQSSVAKLLIKQGPVSMEEQRAREQKLSMSPKNVGRRRRPQRPDLVRPAATGKRMAAIASRACAHPFVTIAFALSAVPPRLHGSDVRPGGGHRQHSGMTKAQGGLGAACRAEIELVGRVIAAYFAPTAAAPDSLLV